MEKFIISYIERTKENYDREYPGYGHPGNDVYRGRARRVPVQAEDCKQAWTQFVEGLKQAGWKHYAFATLIKDGITISHISVCAEANQRYVYGYNLHDIITDIAENAQPGWFD